MNDRLCALGVSVRRYWGLVIFPSVLGSLTMNLLNLFTRQEMADINEGVNSIMSAPTIPILKININ